MYLSRLALNVNDRRVRRDIASPYELHRTVWRAFPPNGPGRVLFRLDPDPSGLHSFVLVQSDLQPDWTQLAEKGANYLLDHELKTFQPSFTPGQRLRFRLRANPTKKVGTWSKAERLATDRNTHTKNGHRLALLREEEQLTWLLHKAEPGGFRIPGQWIHQSDRKVANFRVEITPEGWLHCGKHGHNEGRLFSVRFEGLLEVTDPDRFAQTLAEGIGPAKGFGFGLLSLAPPEA